ncbi:hypothetical protein ACLB2K_016548 [Fragaria x ananassa]
MVISDAPDGRGGAAAAESDLRRRPIARGDADSESRDGNLVVDSTSSEDSVLAKITGHENKVRNEAPVESVHSGDCVAVDDAESEIGLEERVHHHPVAELKDLERENRAGEEDERQRKQRPRNHIKIWGRRRPCLPHHHAAEAEKSSSSASAASAVFVAAPDGTFLLRACSADANPDEDLCVLLLYPELRPETG